MRNSYRLLQLVSLHNQAVHVSSCVVWNKSPGFELFADASGAVIMTAHPQSTLKGLYGQDLGFPAWDDHDFLVFMDPIKGTQAPLGDLRFIVHTTTGGRQIAIVQCKKSGPVSSNTPDRTASAQQVKKDLQLLKDCVQR